MSLPILGYHSYEHYVENLERAEKFYTKTLGFKTIGRTSQQAEKTHGMRRFVLAGGKDIHLILSTPLTEWSVASKYLKQHPEGIGFLNFRVADLETSVSFLEKRQATFLFAPQTEKNSHGNLHQTAIATALDDVSIRLIDDSQYDHFGTHFEMDQPAGSYESPHGFEYIDHMTSNTKTLQPLTSFLFEVLGFEKLWEIDFHTNDVNPSLAAGSGLKSAVAWHPKAKMRFANNEPLAPSFRNSQIDIYLHDNHGSGIQHVALGVKDIIHTMDQIRPLGGKFLNAPEEYYRQLTNRLKKTGFKGEIKEDLLRLEAHSILADASPKGYLLQIFSRELSEQLKDPRGGPLFYEVIQRAGDEGFGAGNFRALFETIELDQIALKKTAETLPPETI